MRVSWSRLAVLSAVVGVALVPVVGVPAVGASAVGDPGVAGAASATYQLGCEGPLTGASAGIGISACRAVELAVLQANSAGTLAYHLGVERIDDKGDPVHAPAAASVAVNDARILAVVGPDFSGTALAAEPMYGDAHLLAVTPSATNPLLTKPGAKPAAFYRAIAPDTDEGSSAGRYIRSLPGVHRVAVVNDESDYGKLLSHHVLLTLRARHITTTRSKISPSAGHSRFVAEARAITRSHAGAVYFGGYDVPAGQLAKALHQAGYKGTFITDDGARTATFIKYAGKSAAASARFTSPYAPDTSYGPVAAFDRQFRKQFGKSPSEPAVEAYDAANSVIHDLAALSATPTRAEVLSAYRSVSWHGLTGVISYTRRHELRRPVMFLYRVRGRQIRLARKLTN